MDDIVRLKSVFAPQIINESSEFRRNLDSFTSNKQHLKQEVKPPLSSLVKTREGLK